MKSKLEIKISENKSGGKLYSYHLMTKRGDSSFVGGGEIFDAKEMRQIAKALIAKAKEIEYEQIMNEPNKFCEDCGCVLHDDNIMTIVKSNLEIYVCIDCYKE